MTGNPLTDGNSPIPEDQLSDLLGDYLDRRNAGEKITVELLYDEHPECAADLSAGLKTLDALDSGEPAGTLGDRSHLALINLRGQKLRPECEPRKLGPVTRSACRDSRDSPPGSCPL